MRTVTAMARQFIAEVESLQGAAEVVSSEAELEARMAAVLTEAGARRVVQARHPLLTGFAAAFPAGEVITWGDRAPDDLRRELATCDAGIAVGVAAIAATGTVALAAGPDQGRTLPFLPPRVLLVVPPGRLVPDLGAAFALALAAGSPPSVLNLVTGPSRTSDIENDLSIGVHGPGKLHVFLCEPEN